MKLLAIDTATERCSVALKSGSLLVARAQPSARDHAKLILPMIDSVLQESGIAMEQLEGLAFGRGPGGFTGVRLAVATVQGLGTALGIPVVGVSNLAAVAQQFAGRLAAADRRIVVCMDARMGEVYWAIFELGEDGAVRPAGVERVDRPEAVMFDADAVVFGVGTGFRAYGMLRAMYPTLQIYDDALPHAAEVARLAESRLLAGEGVAAASAAPVYIRDKVVR